MWDEAMKNGIGLEVPSTPNKPLGRGPVEKRAKDMNYGIYEHMEPNTPDSTMANEELL